MSKSPMGDLQRSGSQSIEIGRAIAREPKSGEVAGVIRQHMAPPAGSMPDSQSNPMPQTPHAAGPAPRQVSPAAPCAMVVFGAAGDLTRRLVVPALYNLSRTKLLPEKFALIGVDLAAATTQSWRDHLHEMLDSFVGKATAEFDVDRIDVAAWERLAETMLYIPGDITKPDLYEQIRGALEEVGKTQGTQGNVIFYLAVSDRFFGPVVEQLGNAKLTSEGEDRDGECQFWRRVVIESSSATASTPRAP